MAYDWDIVFIDLPMSVGLLVDVHLIVLERSAVPDLGHYLLCFITEGAAGFGEHC